MWFTTPKGATLVNEADGMTNKYSRKWNLASATGRWHNKQIFSKMESGFCNSEYIYSKYSKFLNTLY